MTHQGIELPPIRNIFEAINLDQNNINNNSNNINNNNYYSPRDMSPLSPSFTKQHLVVNNNNNSEIKGRNNSYPALPTPTSSTRNLDNINNYTTSLKNYYSKSNNGNNVVYLPQNQRFTANVINREVEYNNNNSMYGSKSTPTSPLPTVITQSPMTHYNIPSTYSHNNNNILSNPQSHQVVLNTTMFNNNNNNNIHTKEESSYNNNNSNSNNNKISKPTDNNNNKISKPTDNNNNKGKLKKRHSSKRSNLPKKTVQILNDWLLNHLQDPYPTPNEKLELLKLTGLTKIQLSNWFINVRRRKIFVDHNNASHK